MKRTIRRMHRLCMLALVAGFAGSASAQVVGPNVAEMNVLAATQITLTGVNPTQFLHVPVVGVSPGITLTMTNASVGTAHLGDGTAANAQSEAVALNNSLLAPAGAAVIVLGAGTLPDEAVGAGTTLIQAAASLSNTTTIVTITGTPTSIVIIQVLAGALTFVDVDIVLAGGIQPGNVYWQVRDAIHVTNTSAANKTMPGTLLSQSDVTTGAVAVVSQGAGSLSIGRLISRQGGISITQSGAGTLSAAYPAGGTGAGPIIAPGNGCSSGDRIFPSPATTPSSQIAYCMDQPGNVIIRVYNAIGDIAAKIDESKPAGPQTSPLNTGRLAPGVYFFVVEKHYGGGVVNRGVVKKFGVVH